MDIASALGDLVAAKQKEVDVLNAVIEEVSKPAAELPVGDAEGLAKLQEQVDALVKERDALRAAIQTEVDDHKADTERLEKAIAPVEVAPVPEVPAPAPEPETPAEEPAPVPEAPAEDPAPAADDGSAPKLETRE